MRARRARAIAALAAIASLAGCTGISDPTDLLAGASGDPTPVGSVVAGVSASAGAGPTAPASLGGSPSQLDVALSGPGDYRMFELGPGSEGQRIRISPVAPPAGGPFVLVLFDASQNLLTRHYLAGISELNHVLRASSDNLILGVMIPAGGRSGSLRLSVRFENAAGIPAVQPQTVWFNFAGDDAVTVGGDGPVRVRPFDAAELGPAYAGHTETIKAAIVAAVREDYAPYDVTILTSDETPEPAEPHSVIHFGGYSSGLLGLADNVDEYNRDTTQQAIVYVETFAIYDTMQLDDQQMAFMIANVASHELGHLLGLYHTREPSDVMDTTGTAWDLTADQQFRRAPLEPSVFATGMQDSGMLLRRAVGLASKAATARRRTLSPRQRQEYGLLRAVLRPDLSTLCGTCRNLDR